MTGQKITCFTPNSVVRLVLNLVFARKVIFLALEAPVLLGYGWGIAGVWVRPLLGNKTIYCDRVAEISYSVSIVNSELSDSVLH